MELPKYGVCNTKARTSLSNETPVCNRECNRGIHLQDFSNHFSI
uniref:Uncharacterized protein n=1 Tax=Arundo donax TaxID=35708 RepID=A0A0A9CSG1_ARUDO